MLPPEILGEVFRSIVVELFLAAQKEPFGPRNSITSSAIRLSSIDSYWRSVALSAHTIWSYIKISHGKPWNPHPSLLALALARSQRIPLHIIIVMRHNPPVAPEALPAWNALAEQLMARAGFLQVVSLPETNYTYQLVAGNTLFRSLLLKKSPLLRTLRYTLLVMAMSYPPAVMVTDWAEVRGQILPHAPLLVELSLVNFGGLELDMLRPEMIRGLQRFSHRADGSMLVADVLAAAPKLRQLSLTSRELLGGSSAVSNLRIYVNLVSLSAEASALAQLNRTSAPNLRTLNFDVKFHNEYPGYFNAAYLAGFLVSTPYLALEHLSLPDRKMWSCEVYPESMAAVVPLFAYMPNILSLSLPRLNVKGSCITEWTKPDNVRLLPKLQVITLRGMIPSGNDAKLFKNFFRRRQTAMAEICDSGNRLPLTIEMDHERDTLAVEEICDLLGRYVMSIRVVGSPHHKLPDTVRFEVRDGLRRAGPSWHPAKGH